MNKIVKFNKLCADYGILAAYAFGSGAEKAVELIEGRETEGAPTCTSGVQVILLSGWKTNRNLVELRRYHRGFIV